MLTLFVVSAVLLIVAVTRTRPRDARLVSWSLALGASGVWVSVAYAVLRALWG